MLKILTKRCLFFCLLCHFVSSTYVYAGLLGEGKNKNQNYQLTANLDSLPYEVILRIANFLNFDDLIALSNTGRSFREQIDLNKRLEALSKKYYDANKDAYRKAIENIEISSIPDYDIDEPLSRLAYHRWKSNQHLKSLKDYQPLKLKGHTGSVNAVIACSKGLLVSCSSDKTLKLWDPTKPKGKQCIATLEGHTDSVNAVIAWSNGLLVSCSSDKTLKLWDPTKPKGKQCIATLEGHTDSVNAVIAWSNGLLLSFSSDNIRKTWDPTKPDGEQCVETLEDNSDSQRLTMVPSDSLLTNNAFILESVILLPDGWLLSFSSDDPTNSDKKQCVATLKGYTSILKRVTLLSNGCFVTCFPDNTLKVCDQTKPDGEQCVATLEGHTDSVNAVTALLDGRLMSYSSDNIVKVWDLTKLDGEQCVATLKVYTGKVKTITSFNNRGVAEYGLERPVAPTCAVKTITALPDGRVVLFYSDNTLGVWYLYETEGVGGIFTSPTEEKNAQ
ncbi:MAG: hypothetical protein PUP46_10610 [Endozoicomonas sp. (ex Botrylloides leachii)]|nr:hypothetical protein [Endozoicomonas sp. (ex Botrylloides leachii)]